MVDKLSSGKHDSGRIHIVQMGELPFERFCFCAGVGTFSGLGEKLI